MQSQLPDSEYTENLLNPKASIWSLDLQRWSETVAEFSRVLARGHCLFGGFWISWWGNNLLCSYLHTHAYTHTSACVCTHMHAHVDACTHTSIRTYFNSSQTLSSSSSLVFALYRARSLSWRSLTSTWASPAHSQTLKLLSRRNLENGKTLCRMKFKLHWVKMRKNRSACVCAKVRVVY